MSSRFGRAVAGSPRALERARRRSARWRGAKARDASLARRRDETLAEMIAAAPRARGRGKQIEREHGAGRAPPVAVPTKNAAMVISSKHIFASRVVALLACNIRPPSARWRRPFGRGSSRRAIVPSSRTARGRKSIDR